MNGEAANTPSKVTSETIMKDLLGEAEQSSVVTLSGLQKAGVNLVIGVGLLAGLIVLIILSFWSQNRPSMPQLPTDATTWSAEITANTTSMLDQYKLASDLAYEIPAKWFDTIIVKIFVPLLTLLLGYVFGTNRSDNPSGA